LPLFNRRVIIGSEMSLITLKNVSRTFGEGDGKTIALQNIDLEIETGEFVAIVGASGSGKSTMMNIVGLLDSPTKGKYKFERKDVSKLSDPALAKIRRKKIGFVFQSFNLLQRHTAIENVMLPMVYARVDRFGREKAAAELLRKVGLEERLYHYPNELSGGQMQRVAVARALANKPKLILADEPTGNLDTVSGQKVLSLLGELHEEGNTIVVVSHDEAVKDFAQRIITLKDGEIETDKKSKSTKNKASTTEKSKNTKKESKESKNKKDSKTSSDKTEKKKQSKSDKKTNDSSSKKKDDK
jgi:putative ABC transport system ATP-binding protein